MGTSRAEGKRSLKEMVMEDEEEEEDDESGGLGFEEEEKKKKGRRGSGGAAASSGASMLPRCQADHCTADMADSKRYYKRHKVCEYHAKASFVLVNGLQQRFCQQCSRFHEVSEFDDTKRSCRRRLAGHNERRRKSSSDCLGDGSN